MKSLQMNEDFQTKTEPQPQATGAATSEVLRPTLPLDQVIRSIRNDSQAAPSDYLNETEALDGGE